MNINDIQIRTSLRPGDIGYVIYRHGLLYNEECGYGVNFEAYVAGGLSEFYKNFNPERDCAWVCEHQNNIIGFLALMHRAPASAQLRYFYLEPAYRGISLGKKLMSLFMDFLHDHNYSHAYLLTTDELHAAATLYKRYGFTLTEESESDLFGKAVKEQRYDWKAP